MIVMAVVDNSGGMAFHSRRQSQDRILRKRIREIAGKRLWMNAYSLRLFRMDGACETEYLEAEDFLFRTPEGEYCFVEDQSLLPCASRIEQVILFHWNRDYPADRWFDLDLSDWTVSGRESFSGSSHPEITMEIYGRQEIRTEDN